MKNIKEIQVDVPTEESEWSAEGEFFIAVLISEGENLAFNCTFGNEGIYRQMLTRTANLQEEPTDIWKTLVIKDGNLVDKRPAKWIDDGEGGKAVINGKVWEFIPTLKISLPEDVKKKLLEFTSQIYKCEDNPEELDELFEELDSYIRQVVKQRLGEIIEEELKELESDLSVEEVKSLLRGGRTSTIPTLAETTDLSREELLSHALDEFLYDIGYIEEKPDFDLEEHRLE